MPVTVLRGDQLERPACDARGVVVVRELARGLDPGRRRHHRRRRSGEPRLHHARRRREGGRPGRDLAGRRSVHSLRPDQRGLRHAAAGHRREPAEASAEAASMRLAALRLAVRKFEPIHWLQLRRFRLT